MNHSFIKWLAASSICFGTGTFLKDIHYSIKQNGVMVNLDYTDPINDDDIIGWKSDRGWVYLTLLGVRAPRNKYPQQTFNSPVKKIVIDDFDESIQVAILINKPILGYDILNSKTSSSTVVFIHTEMKSSEVASLQKHINENGASVFNLMRTSRFPKYNKNFKVAFDQARAELGPNSIFEYFGKLYITNHPGESGGKMIAGLQSGSEEPEDIYIPEVYVRDPELNNEPSLTFDPANIYADEDAEPLTISSGWIEINEQETGAFPTTPRDPYDQPLVTDELFDESEPLTISPNWVDFEKPELDEFLIMTPEEFKQSSPSVSAEDLGVMLELYDWIDVQSVEESTGKDFFISDKLYPNQVNVQKYVPKETPDDILVQQNWYKLQSRLISLVPAGIRVISNLEGVPIYVDGNLVGETPLRGPVSISPGWHQVSGFTPLYVKVLNGSGMEYVNDDPILRNNQMFGSRTVYVDPGNVSVVNFRFNEIGDPPKNLAQIQGGMLIGFPVIMALFGLITWGMM